MLGRKIRGLIPLRNINNVPENYENIRNKLAHRQNQQKRYYDSDAHDLDVIPIGTHVYVKKEMDKPLEPGMIIDKCDRPRSYKVALEDHSIIERNRNHLRPYTKNHSQNVNENIVNNNQPENQDQLQEKIQENGVENPESTINNETSSTYTRSGRLVKTPRYLKDYVQN